MFDLQMELGYKARDCSLGILIMDNIQTTGSDKLRLMKLEIENEIRGTVYPSLCLLQIKLKNNGPATPPLLRSRQQEENFLLS